MAIQLPNPGLGDGQTGDNEFVMWTKVKDNFNNSTHAASRTVGLASGHLVESQDIRKAYANISVYEAIPASFDFNNIKAGDYIFYSATANPNRPPVDYASVYATRNYSGESQLTVIAHDYITGGITTRAKQNDNWSGWATHYHSLNTTKEPGTGYIKASSPVLHLLHHGFEKIHEAEQLDIKVEKPKKGVYKITGTTGLRKNDGWYFSPPKDEHNNVLCMVEVEEDGDVVTVKTYKKKFDFETVSIVPDYDNPTDIPEGAIVMLRFNDLPRELANESKQ